MRISVLTAVALISSQAVSAWNPLKQADATPATPLPSSEPKPTLAHVEEDPFAPASPEAIPGASVTVALADDAETATATATPKRLPLQPVPTPKDFFNGDKPLASEPYDGLEFSAWKGRLVFRPKLFLPEALAIVAVILFGLFAKSSKKANETRAEAFLEVTKPVLDSAFAASGVNEGPGIKLKERDASGNHFVAWFSGRKGLNGLRINFDLKPRADPTAALYHLVRQVMDLTYASPKDTIELVFEITASIDETVLAVTKKDGMQALKNSRWDLRAFTSLASAWKDALPIDITVFNETSAASDTLLKNQLAGLVQFLQSEETTELKSLFQHAILSDIGGMIEDPSDARLAGPEPLKKSKRFTFVFQLPSSVSDYEKTLPLIHLAVNLADALSQTKPQLSNGDANKLRKRRTEILAEITKEFRKEQAELAIEKTRELKQKEKDAKYNALSAEQQKKADELEKRRKERKASGRTVQRK